MRCAPLFQLLHFCECTICMLVYAGLLRVGRLMLRRLLVCAERSVACYVVIHVSCVWCCLRLTVLVLACVVLGEFD